MGRLTMNPMAHMDVLGTVILPLASLLFGGILFGWAKPVPVNSRNLNRPKQDMFWIALAGPASNVLLFVVGLVFLGLVHHQVFFTPSVPMMQMLIIFLQLNLYLAFFNMIPLHPLDGGKVIARFLPIKWNMWLEQNQYQLNMALLFLIIFGGLAVLAYPVNWIVNTSINLVTGGL